MKHFLYNIFLTEPWTPGKQILSVIVIFLALAPFALLYLFRSDIKFLIKTLLT